LTYNKNSFDRKAHPVFSLILIGLDLIDPWSAIWRLSGQAAHFGIAGEESLTGIFAEDLFTTPKDAIGLPQADYQVASIGIHQVFAQYNASTPWMAIRIFTWRIKSSLGRSFPQNFKEQCLASYLILGLALSVLKQKSWLSVRRRKQDDLPFGPGYSDL
jgi:hypothetical protein